MGKSWKEKPGKYRHNKDFQKKQKQKHQKYDKLPAIVDEDGFLQGPFEDPPEYHESFS